MIMYWSACDGRAMKPLYMKFFHQAEVVHTQAPLSYGHYAFFSAVLPSGRDLLCEKDPCSTDLSWGRPGTTGR